MATLTTITGGGAFTAQNIRNINSNFSALNTGSSGGSILHQATVTLTNTQILHLPTVPVEILAAPGANKIVLFQYGTAYFNWAGDYGNNDGGSALELKIHGNKIASTPGMNVVLAGGENSMSTFVPFTSVEANRVIGNAGYYNSDIVNKALAISGTSSDSGDYTDGNVDNTMTISVAYLILNTSTGLFE